MIQRNIIYVLLFAGVALGACSSGGSPEETPDADTLAPTNPSNLSATNTTISSTELAWAASTDNIAVTSYSIYQDDVALVSTQSNTHVVNGLTDNTTYVYTVKARDAAGNESGFSNAVSVTTESNEAELVTLSGNIESYLGNFIDGVPGSSGNNYLQPTTAQLTDWNEVIDALLADNISVAVEKSALLNYQVTEFTDTSIVPNQVFYVLEEKSPRTNHWGTYTFNMNPVINNLVLQAPHIKNDINTGKEAVFCFKNTGARAVFLSGTHRCNHSSTSSCSGTTSTCNSGSQPFRISDLAHNTTSTFQKTTENVFNAISNSVFIQLHGFGKRDTDPYVIISNGTRETPTIDYAAEIQNALLAEDASLTFRLAHIDTDWTRLIGFTNTQGRLINNSTNPCSTSATTTSGRFIHIEQERSKLREDETGWSKMSNALSNVFN